MEMETTRLKRVNEILLAALERATQERPAFLEEVCGEDDALRRGVESILAGDGAGAADLSRPAFGLTADAEREFAEGDRIGPYHVVRKLGQGGMGVVYLAERADGEYHRRVAVKVLKPGLATEGLVRRFRVERQILANLDHPGIARLHEGGTTEKGQPYLVMEYVEGEPVDRYCRDRRLSIRERLELFRKVCSAVEFAHRNLVVHRDLKPSNILVTAEGEPKLLDFGIAKLLDADSGLTVTDAGARPMTPDYASPEQVRGEPITTASDVYSLGVLLYELLSGRRPYRFETNRLEEVCRVVCEEEPERPSTAVGESGTDRGEDRRRLRGDLDNIALMALRKEPRHRYSSAEQLSEDLGRYLEGHPVRASRDTFVYRTGKLLRRRKRELAALVLAAFGLMGFAVDRGLRERRTALERDRAQRVTDFLVEIFAVSDPGKARGKSVTAREILDRGAERIEKELVEEPVLQAALMNTMGKVYRNLGLFQEAAPLLEGALARRRRFLCSECLETAESLQEMGKILWEMNDYKRAEEHFREALAIHRKLLDEDHPDMATVLHGLAVTVRDQGRYDSAEKLYREALAIRRVHQGDEPLVIAQSLHHLALVLNLKGKYREAEFFCRKSLALRSEILDEDHPDIATSMFTLGSLRQSQGDLENAQDLYRKSLAIRRRQLGSEHPEVANILFNMAELAFAEKDYESSIEILQEVLTVRRKLLGHDHIDVAKTLANTAKAYHGLGNHEEAARLSLQGLEAFRSSHGEDHPHYLTALNNHVVILTAKGDFLAAERFSREVLEAGRRLLGDGHTNVAVFELNLAKLLHKMDRGAEAVPLARHGARALRSKLPEGHDLVTRAETILGRCLTGLGRFQEAASLLEKTYRTLEAQEQGPAGRADDVLQALAELYEAWDKPQEVARYRELLGMAAPR